MKYHLLFAYTIILFLTILSLVSAAPARNGITINSQTMECGYYSGGDEFYICKPYDGWVTYYSDYDEDTDTSTMVTPFGSCNSMTAKTCCEQLNLTFKGDTTRCHITGIGVSRLVTELWPVILVLIGLIVFTIFKIRYFRKKNSKGV